MESLPQIKIKCPLCGSESVWRGNVHRPFCSEECKQKDLGNWATERYRVPSEDDPKSEEFPTKSEPEE